MRFCAGAKEMLANHWGQDTVFGHQQGQSAVKMMNSSDFSLGQPVFVQHASTNALQLRLRSKCSQDG